MSECRVDSKNNVNIKRPNPVKTNRLEAECKRTLFVDQQQELAKKQLQSLKAKTSKHKKVPQGLGPLLPSEKSGTEQNQKNQLKSRELQRQKDPGTGKDANESINKINETLSFTQIFELPPPDKDHYLFSLKRCDVDNYTKIHKKKGIRRFESHPHDRMVQRIENIECDFKPRSIEESETYRLNHIKFQQELKGEKGNKGKNSKDHTAEKIQTKNQFAYLNKSVKVYPTLFINRDHRRSLFAVEFLQPQSKEAILLQHENHRKVLMRALERHEPLEEENRNKSSCGAKKQRESPGESVIYVPKPASSYCFICRQHFEDYLTHTKSEGHRFLDYKCQVWYFIHEVAQGFRFKAMDERYEAQQKLKPKSRMFSLDQKRIIAEYQRLESEELTLNKSKHRFYMKKMKELDQEHKKLQISKRHIVKVSGPKETKGANQIEQKQSKSKQNILIHSGANSSNKKQESKPKGKQESYKQKKIEEFLGSGKDKQTRRKTVEKIETEAGQNQLPKEVDFGLAKTRLRQKKITQRDS